MKLNNQMIIAAISALFIVGCAGNTTTTPREIPKTNAQEIETVKIENLLRDSLELAEGVEVVMSYLEVPKNTTLPTHYHPGEEFVYILKGSGELKLEDSSVINLKKGDVVKVPLKRAHSFTTFNEAATAIVFRVHEKGQPDRILVD